MTDTTAQQYLSQLKANYENRELEAKRQKQAGIKVVGYVSANVPEELILASGMFPVQVSGDPATMPSVGDEYMEYFHDGEVRSLLDRALRGDFAFLDLLIVPRTSEGYLQLFYYLIELKRIQPSLPLPEIHLFDILSTAFWHTGRYNHARIIELRERLDAVAGKITTNAEISEAIRMSNRSREHLIRLQNLRHQHPTTISGSDALRTIGASSLIDRKSFQVLAHGMIEGAARAATCSGIRLMVKGSPQDNTDFYELVESLGAVIVASDHPHGDGTFEHLVNESCDPIEALTEHYHLHSANVRQYPQSIADTRFLSLVNAAKVDGVIFYLDDWDDTLGWDYPDQKKALDSIGVPSLLLKQQPYFTPDKERQADTVRAFISTLQPQSVAPTEVSA